MFAFCVHPPLKKQKKTACLKKKHSDPLDKNTLSAFLYFFLQTESYISLYIGCVYLAQYVLQKILSNL